MLSSIVGIHTHILYTGQQIVFITQRLQNNVYLSFIVVVMSHRICLRGRNEFQISIFGVYTYFWVEHNMSVEIDIKVNVDVSILANDTIMKISCETV